MVLLAARAGLDTHRDTIDVLHMLGSTDVQVSRLFQRRIALDTLIGGAIGTVLAMVAVVVIGARLAALDSVLVGGVALGGRDWVGARGAAARVRACWRRSPRGSRCCGGCGEVL